MKRKDKMEDETASMPSQEVGKVHGGNPPTPGVLLD